MNKLLRMFILLLICQPCLAQKEVLPRDEQGRYMYYEVTDAKGISKHDLLARATHFINSYNKKSLKAVDITTDSTLKAPGEFLINKGGSSITPPAGAINYSLTIEVRNEKYRFWLTDFQFFPYERDRYGNFVPSTVYGQALEKPPGKLNASEWNNYLKATATQAKTIADLLKKQMAGAIEEPVVTERVKKSW